MKTKYFIPVFVGIFSLAFGGAHSGYADENAPSEKAKEFQQTYFKLPLSFEANLGQTDPEVQFLSRGNGYDLFLTRKEAVLVRRAEAEAQVVRLQLLGAKKSPKITGLESIEGKSNYFLGNDPAQWRTNVPHYAKVKYEAVYPGIDLVYHGSQQKLEYDFVVAPGADPKKITLRFKGAKELKIDKSGDLVIKTGKSEIRQHKPRVYQMIAGAEKMIEGNYRLKGARQVCFQVAAYDKTQPLIIDPIVTLIEPGLAYSTYLGGNFTDSLSSIAVDSAGNAYVTGSTVSTDFPTVNFFQQNSGGDQDAFITKFDPSGALLFSTYLGGSYNESQSSIATDSAGNAYVTGKTSSRNFPTRNAFQPNHGGGWDDAFITKFDPSGTLLFSTYLGGSWEENYPSSATDSAGNTYVTGETVSTDFPTLNPFQPNSGGLADAFITKFDPSGALLFSTYLGGSHNDYKPSIATDSAGNTYVAGGTWSTNFPTRNAFQPNFGGRTDAFIAKFDPSGTLLFSTYLGGSFYEEPSSIAVDSAGNAYVAGKTSSSDFPTVNAFQPTSGGGWDAFITKFDPSGALLFSTYLGGSASEFSSSIAVDSAGNAYATGSTWSTDFPTLNAFQESVGGGYTYHSDAFIVKIDPAGTLLFSSYLGGSHDDYSIASVIDSAGNAYVSGSTQSTDFPTLNAFQPNSGGGADVFIAKIAEVEVPYMMVTIDIKPGSDPNSINLGSAGVIPVAIFSSAEFDATTVDPGSVTLAGAGVSIKGKNNRYLSHTEDLNGDGLLDMVCQIETDQLSLELGSATAVLKGRTFSNMRIIGSDSVNIVQ